MPKPPPPLTITPRTLLPLLPRVPTITLAATVFAALTIYAAHVWPVLLLDGGLAALVLLAAAGWGAWPTAWLGFRTAPRSRQFLLALALGTGLTSTFALILGAAGLLNTATAWALIILGGLVAIPRLITKRTDHPPAPTAPSPRTVLARTLLLLPLAVPLGLMLLGATLPPGVLWIAEGRGYDVLEYHLQAPREYLAAGHIHFLPHNVYASFPQQIEAQYLLLMHLLGDAYDAAIPAQLLHALLGLAALAALAAWSPPGWGRWLAVAVVGSVPWLAYVGCLAYVELGLLLYAVVAGGLLLQSLTAPGLAPRTALAAGLCAGLAGASKYTGLALVAALLAAALLLTAAAPWRARLRHAAIFALAAALAVSPWLIRNTAYTGNPVYPFAYEWFGGRAWSAEQAAQWAAGHQPTGAAATLTGRLNLAAQELWRTGMFGQAVLPLALAVALLIRDRRTAFLALWAAGILTLWLLLTHVPGRFAIPLLAPLGLLIGRLGEVRWPGLSLYSRQPTGHPPLPLVVAAVILATAGAIDGGRRLVGLWQHEQRAVGVDLRDLVGATRAWRDLEPLNALPPTARIHLVGPAAVLYVDRPMRYTVVFNRDPWLTHATATDPAAAVAWLRMHGTTHVVFSWPEIDRLRATYGFSDQVTRPWVAQLAAAGLRRVFAEPPDRPALEVFEVSPE